MGSQLLGAMDHDAALQSIATVLNGRPGLIGRYDLNSEFYRLQSASLFLNSSFGIGPEFSQSGLEGPSIFPNTSVGARFAIKPIEEIVLRTAASTECRWIDRTEREHYSRRVTAY